MVALLLEVPSSAGEDSAEPQGFGSRGLLALAAAAAILALGGLAAILLRAGVIAPDRYPLRVVLPAFAAEALMTGTARPERAPPARVAVEFVETPPPAEAPQLAAPVTPLEGGELDPQALDAAPPLALVDFDMAALPGSLRTDGQEEGGMLTVGKPIRIAITRSTVGKSFVGTNVLAMKVSGNRKMNEAFWTTSVSAGWIQYGRRARSVAGMPNSIASTNVWISVAAWGPMM